MKTEILTKQDFQPIELKITIETKRELEFLWCLFNAPDADIREIANDMRPISIAKFDVTTISFGTLWDKLNYLNIVK